MKATTATVSDPVGFHLRAAGRIVKLTKRFSAEVTIRYHGRAANAKSIMGLASLAAECGSRVDIEADGSDESEALDALVQLIAIELAHPEQEP
ncbi:MAG: HPr family phosphocarrier protein [Candidatus Krumholzibacteriia bacterium]